MKKRRTSILHVGSKQDIEELTKRIKETYEKTGRAKDVEVKITALHSGAELSCPQNPTPHYHFQVDAKYEELCQK